MKRKHHGLISIVIIVVVLIPTAIYAVYSLQGANTKSFRSIGTSSEYAIPDLAAIKEISKLESKMVELTNPPEPESMSDPSIRFWHYSDKDYSRYKTIDQGGEKVDLRATYALTFTFASGEKKFCIIDGSFYPQGAELPDGGKILKIESGKVWVKKGELATWISLPETTKWGEIQ